MVDYAAARLNMVEGQLRTNRVTEPALMGAFLAVPRERFVPAAFAGAAYVDEDIPLGRGRFLMEPLVLARLIQLADLRREERALFVGAASGYGAAVLAQIAASVVALESDPALAEMARRACGELGYGNVSVVEGPLDKGHGGGAPYHAILFGGAIADAPAALVRQLAEGGRMVAVLKPGSAVGKATLMRRSGTVLSRRPAFDAATPVLPGFAPEPSFVF